MTDPQTITSTDYKHEFYGIKSPYGNLWSTNPYPSVEKAQEALREFWKDDEAKFAGFKIVPVCIQLTEIEEQQL